MAEAAQKAAAPAATVNKNNQVFVVFPTAMWYHRAACHIPTSWLSFV